MLALSPAPAEWHVYSCSCPIYRALEMVSCGAKSPNYKQQIRLKLRDSHCAPLERGDWRYRYSIDISLRWSVKLNKTKINGFSTTNPEI